MNDDFGALRRAKTMLLTTYKRDGTGVGTPVNVAFDGDHAYFRTYDKAWKSRRLRRNPEVDVAPSDFRGKVTGQHLRGTARLLEGDEAGAASRALARRYPLLHGMVVPLMHRAKGYKTLHYELSAGPRAS
jgi:PPOX class probable F420-dependent enzyme